MDGESLDMEEVLPVFCIGHHETKRPLPINVLGIQIARELHVSCQWIVFVAAVDKT